MSEFQEVSERIIKAQETVIGPIAWIEASHVPGLKVDVRNRRVSVTNNDKKVIDKLVGRYETLFGRASHEVCREAAAGSLLGFSVDEIPDSLR